MINLYIIAIITDSIMSTLGLSLSAGFFLLWPFPVSLNIFTLCSNHCRYLLGPPLMNIVWIPPPPFSGAIDILGAWGGTRHPSYIYYITGQTPTLVCQCVCDVVHSSECWKSSGFLVCKNHHQLSTYTETVPIAKKREIW